MADHFHDSQSHALLLVFGLSDSHGWRIRWHKRWASAKLPRFGAFLDSERICCFRFFHQPMLGISFDSAGTPADCFSRRPEKTGGTALLKKPPFACAALFFR